MIGDIKIKPGKKTGEYRVYLNGCDISPVTHGVMIMLRPGLLPNVQLAILANPELMDGVKADIQAYIVQPEEKAEEKASEAEPQPEVEPA